jgi:coronin-1B/1C/6
VSESTAPASHKEFEEIKNLIAQQTKIIADQASHIQKLTSEVEALKSKLN